MTSKKTRLPQDGTESVPASSAGPPARPAAAFPIVGIGASAGGLESFDKFLRAMPADSGMAFVLVPHLDPGHHSILTEILQRTTSMPVVEAQDQMRVVPSSVYIIPPNRDLRVFHGSLQLSAMEAPRGQRLPIDAFLRSLAEDQGENAIGIILSGTGTDGTLGLRAILGAGGVSLVEDPATAKYDGMPMSAIQAGYANQVLAAEKMPQALLSGMRVNPLGQEAPLPPLEASGINRILLMLRNVTGHDFSLYKKSTIRRRVERRMLQHAIEDMGIYARYLKENRAEAQALFKELLINVTSFFRDTEAFVCLQQDILPHLLNGKPEGYVFRVWVAGCATGEEAYSVAILLRERMDESDLGFKVQIFATDLDDDAIACARTGFYPVNIAQDLSPERLRRHFGKEESGYRINKDISDMVVFAVQNVAKDPPFTRLDLLCCRNLMIYLEPELQNRIIPVFHYALKPDGVLFLSPSEGIGAQVGLFAPLNRKWKFYRAIHTDGISNPALDSHLNWKVEHGSKVSEGVMNKSIKANFAELTRRMLLQVYAPASVLTDPLGNILYVHGDTGLFLRPAPGHATLNVIEMAREGLQLELRTAIRTAVDAGTATLDRELTMQTSGVWRTLNFSVHPLPGFEAQARLLLISFKEVCDGSSGQPVRRRQKASPTELGRIEELERELDYTRENLQSTIEEQNASNEELKSSYEEMQSTNEELQSSNEELETSKEELQSVNEELITVNAELQAKIEQLANMQNDMKNLLDNIKIGIVFLDGHLVIRRFTREAERVYRLIASDVGRPLADIKSNLQGMDLLDEVRQVLDTLAPCEREVYTTEGACYMVRIQAYRTLENVIAGVVLTFTDISQRVKAEASAQTGRELAEAFANAVREPLLVLDDTLRIVAASRPFCQLCAGPQDVVGITLFELGRGQWDKPDLHPLLEKLLLDGQAFEGYELGWDLPGIGHRTWLLNARRIDTRTEAQRLILLSLEEVLSR